MANRNVGHAWCLDVPPEVRFSSACSYTTCHWFAYVQRPGSACSYRLMGSFVRARDCRPQYMRARIMCRTHILGEPFVTCDRCVKSRHAVLKILEHYPLCRSRNTICNDLRWQETKNCSTFSWKAKGDIAFANNKSHYRFNIDNFATRKKASWIRLVIIKYID